MPITEAIARRQIKRFADFAQFPEHPEGLRELVKAFLAVSHNPDHAERIGDELMRAARFCPKPVDVFEVAESIAQNVRRQPDEWSSQQRPGDVPFNGLADLIDDRLLEVFRRRAETAKTHAERESAKRFLRLREEQPVAPGGGQ